MKRFGKMAIFQIHEMEPLELSHVAWVPSNTQAEADRLLEKLAHGDYAVVYVARLKRRTQKTIVVEDTCDLPDS